MAENQIELEKSVNAAKSLSKKATGKKTAVEKPNTENFEQVAQHTAKSREVNVEYPDPDCQKYYSWLTYSDGSNEKDNIVKTIQNGTSSERSTIVFYFTPPGTGKTTLGYDLARDFGCCPIQVVNCVSSMEPRDLLGSRSSDGAESGIIWEYGAVPALILSANRWAKLHPESKLDGVLLFNEFPALPPDTQMGLNSLMDGQNKIILSENNNEVIKIDPDCHILIIATGNPGFLGTFKIQESVRDRVSVWVDFKIPPMDREAFILSQKTGISDDAAIQFAKFAESWRKDHYENNQLSLSPSPRSIIKWIELSRIHGVYKAFELSMLYKFSENQSESEFLKNKANGAGIKHFNVSDTRVKVISKEKINAPKVKTPSSARKNRVLTNILNDLTDI